MLTKRQRWALDLFAMDGDRCLIQEQDLGIINGWITANTLYRDVATLRGLYAPPFASNGFLLELRLAGEKVPTRRFTWRPTEVHREGALTGLHVVTDTIAMAHARTMMLAVTVTNTTATRRTVPVQIHLAGGLDSTPDWSFVHPKGLKDTRDTVTPGHAVKANDAGAIVVDCDLPGLSWRSFSQQWETSLTLGAKSSKTFHLALAVGQRAAAIRDAAAAIHQPTKSIEAARVAFAEKVIGLYDKLPTLRSDNAQLVRWYNRSLMHLLLNQWNAPDFLLRPYYSTGSVGGGCVCSYLWDFGENWEVFNLYDPAALRSHVKAFLNIDLTKHFAFMPFTGDAYGPWYYINQEKIIFLIYHYVMHTGDTAFLHEVVNGKAILAHLVEQAMVGDSIMHSAVLADYGTGNHHLELRRQYRYDNVLPDMNGRRYACYRAVDALCTRVGYTPLCDGVEVNFPERAEALKQLLLKTLWSDKHNWFYWLDARGNRHLRYTVQMFKLIDSDVLESTHRKALLSHLNDREFLSDFGLHSMAKHDEAYDQVDIDNGGGGCCTCFPPTIIEKLYRVGESRHADDILSRVLWWADRLPYWSDSIVANFMDYRRDTPLQNAIGSVAAAQCVIFGLLGVRAEADGRITIAPRDTALARSLTLTGLKIRGKSIDIVVKNDCFRVTVGKKTLSAKLGEAIVV
jgi:hypothetical protein